MAEQAEQINLDTIPGCIAELTACNQEIASFAHDWYSKAGQLKGKEARYKRFYRAALRGTKGSNSEARQATAHAAVEERDPELAEQIENLIAEVEGHAKHFATIERRSSNAQSILSAHRDAVRLDQFTPMGERPMGSRQ